MAHKERNCVYWCCSRNGGTNGQEWYVQMMSAAKSTEPVKPAMVLWESVKHTKK